MNEYEENNEGNMKKYMENKKDSSNIWAVGLRKIPSPSPYLYFQV